MSRSCRPCSRSGASSTSYSTLHVMAATVVTAERIMQNPADQVFDFVATRHFENHPRWDPDLLDMRQTSPGPVGPGTTALIVRRRGRGRVEGTATVTEYEPCRRAAWDVH